MMGCI